MNFNLETIQLILSDTLLTPTQRLIILEFNRQASLDTSYTAICDHLVLSKANLTKSIKALIDKHYITRDNQALTCVYNNQSITCTLLDINFGPVRKARPAVLDSVTKARQKLDQLRMVGFVGIDGLIAKLSRDYDHMLVKFGGKNARSLPPNHQQALKSKNWIHFKRLYNLLVSRQFATEPYLETQFKALRGTGKNGLVFPYPAMLYSTWAINNYTSEVQERQVRGVSEDQFRDECEIIRDSFQSTHDIVVQLRTTWPELTKLQALLMSQDNLSPVYLAMCQDYLKFIVKFQQELPEDIARVLLRFESNKEFKAKVQQIFNEVTK